MSYTLGFQQTDTIAVGSHLNSGETAFNVTSGNFGTPSGTQLYVVDYDIPGTAEIISASVTTTSFTSVVRGLTGGAAGTTNHAAGAKVASIFVPQHYAALVDGTGGSAGMVLQTVVTSFGALATGTTVIPDDDTIPQITEGNEFMTRIITPKSATSTLIIEINAMVSYSVVANLTGALFQDATANALAAIGTVNDAGGGAYPLHLVHSMTSGTTSATTFRFRAGGDGAGTITFNGKAAGRKYGAITKSTMKITEII